MSIEYDFLQGVYEILPEKLYQLSWAGDWRGAVEKHKLTGMIELAGMIPDQLPFRNKVLISWPIDDSDILPDPEAALIIARTGASLIKKGERIGKTKIDRNYQFSWDKNIVSYPPENFHISKL